MSPLERSALRVACMVLFGMIGAGLATHPWPLTPSGRRTYMTGSALIWASLWFATVRLPGPVHLAAMLLAPLVQHALAFILLGRR
ncbi:MAG: hypothetical protein JJ863_21450 [Deltaproteobacteria bacterium]|nr:hypothetical protein [Deltaproteobacteria bacterium]